MFAAIVNERGRHGFDIVVGFESRTAAETWLSEHKVEGIVQPSVAPDDWKPNDGSFDDDSMKGDDGEG